MKIPKISGRQLLKELPFLLIPALLVFFDRFTKQWAIHSLETKVEVINGLLYFDYTWNTGMAFGLLKGFNWLFIIISVIAFGVILYYYLQVSRTEKIGLLFILGGLIGNLIDRITLGQVTDFIQLPYWPVFNIADMAITIGAVILGINYLFRKK